jgi:mannose-6-phosphate isomerase
LHTELALDAIDFSMYGNDKISYKPKSNSPVQLAECPYFTTNLLEIDKNVERDFYEIDSFVIYICMDGMATIMYSGGSEKIGKGEAVLIPASLNIFNIAPESGFARLLEVYIKS